MASRVFPGLTSYICERGGQSGISWFSILNLSDGGQSGISWFRFLNLGDGGQSGISWFRILNLGDCGQSVNMASLL